MHALKALKLANELSGNIMDANKHNLYAVRNAVLKVNFSTAPLASGRGFS